MSATEIVVERARLPQSERSNHVDNLFGSAFPFQLESYVFQMAADLSPDYRGGYWEFYALDNGGFYMAPESALTFRVQCPNGFGGELSGDALGLVACLYAYSHLSFVSAKPTATTYARMYHRLRDYLMEHAEVESILQATD